MQLYPVPGLLSCLFETILQHPASHMHDTAGIACECVIRAWLAKQLQMSF